MMLLFISLGWLPLPQFGHLCGFQRETRELQGQQKACKASCASWTDYTYTYTCLAKASLKYGYTEHQHSPVCSQAGS